MKKNFLGGLILLTGLIGCSDNSYKSLPTVDEDDDPTPMPVLLSLGTPNNSIITKGVGGIENNDGTYNEAWNGSKIYVFSFLKDTENEFTSFTKTMEAYDGENPLTAPACLIDGHLDDEDSKLGKEATVDAVTNAITWTGDNGAVYFPSAKKAYDFYAYYIDDIIPQDITRTTDNISFKFEIDGTQDLMSAKAIFKDEQIKTEVTNSEKENIRQLAFSSYTARRDIQPIINFEHHLTRLKFNIYPGHSDAENVYVESITVESKYKGTFTVVARNSSDMKLDFDDTYTIFTLKDKGSDTGIAADYYKTNPYIPGKSAFEIDSVAVGESIMAAPDNQYKFKIKLKQLITDDSGNPVEPKSYVTDWILTAPEGTSFKAGYQYTVRIAIYGLQKPDIQIIPNKWENGGHVDVDEDDTF